jgi:hypothetical protein
MHPTTHRQPHVSRRRLLGELRFVAGEVVLVVTLYLAYLAVRGAAVGQRSLAQRHGRSIARIESEAHLAHERTVQALATSVHAVRIFFNTVYELGFFPVVIALLCWLAWRERDAYRELRAAMLASIAFAAVCFALYPAAPPRLVPSLDIDDTVGMTSHDVGSFHGLHYNPYASMPSMHVGWTLLVAIVGLSVVRNRLARAALLLYPALMTSAVIVTGNHYFLDCIAGAAIALAALAAVRTRTATRHEGANPEGAYA